MITEIDIQHVENTPKALIVTLLAIVLIHIKASKTARDFLGRISVADGFDFL